MAQAGLQSLQETHCCPLEGMQTSFLANRNAELVTRSAHQEGFVSPSPSKWSGFVMQSKRLHYPHHSSLLPWDRPGDAGDCSGRVVWGSVEASAEALSPSLSRSTHVWKVLRAFIMDCQYALPQSVFRIHHCAFSHHLCECNSLILQQLTRLAWCSRADPQSLRFYSLCIAGASIQRTARSG